VRAIASGRVEDVFTPENLRLAYGGRMELLINGAGGDRWTSP
jgi:hypothetical protein